MAKTDTFFTRLKKRFKITVGTLPDSKIKVPVPAEVVDGKLRKVKFKDENLKLLKYWLEDTYDNAETLKNRFDRYRSLEFAYYNSSIFSKAVNLFPDETMQQDVQADTLLVDSPNKKVVKYINELFEILDISENKLRDIAFSLALYGDKFWIMPTEEDTGYIESIPVDVYSIQDRLEFNAADEAKKRARKRSYGDYVNKNNRLQMLDALLSNSNNDISKYFQTYLFGYQLEKDVFLPPWNVMHFRMFNTQSEFAPFGRSIMINALAPFRQLQSSKNLMALARATGFPIKVFSVEVDESMDPASKWEAVNLAREQFSNLGVDATGKEQFTMDSEVWVPSGLISFDSVESRVNLDQIADVEMLRDDLIMATDIPKGYLIVDRGAFGTSSQALLAQHKPFARKVYHIQSAMLKEITQMVRLHFLMSGAFDPETPFTLSMAFPSTEESSDRLRIKSDTLRLAKDVLDNIGSAVGLERGESLPIEMVQQVFTSLSFLDGEDIDNWVQMITDDKASDESQLNESKRKHIREVLNPQLIKESYFISVKNLHFQEGIIGQKHLYSSHNIDPYQQICLDLFSSPDNKELKG